MHPHHQIHLTVPEHHLPECHNDLSLRGEFHGVGEEVDNDLTDPQLIADDPVRCHLLKICGVVDAVGVQRFGKHIVQPAAQRPQAEGRLLQLHLSGLDTGHIQNVIDERKQMPGKLVGLGEILNGGVLRRKPPLCQRQHTGDAVHGRSYLVGHSEQEAGLELAGLLRLMQPPFIGGHLLPLRRDAADDKKVIFVVPAAVGLHPDPLPIWKLKVCGNVLPTVPA